MTLATLAHTRGKAGARVASFLDSAGGWRIALIALALVTILIRARYFGDPLIDPDEGFYLLTGDRMLQGALPYVDIWDRKPPGLFLLYAAIRAIGGEGVIGYQLAAAMFAAGTAATIAAIARQISSPAAALIAALLYAPALSMSGGQGGQSPVFYNLPIAIAALMTLKASAADIRTIRRLGFAAMLLCGLAMQIKYTALFEGVFLGLVLCWAAWRADPRPLARLLDAALWAGIALLPTLIAYLSFAAIGEGPAFLYANFISIGQRGDYAHGLRDLHRTAERLLVLIIPIVATAFLPVQWRSWRRDPESERAHRFVLLWSAAALAGYFAMGSYFNHYALPLLVPLCVLASPIFTVRAWRLGALFAVVALFVLLARYWIDAGNRQARRGGAAYARQMTDTIRPLLHDGGTLYVFYGEPIFYLTTGSPLPSRWAFPYHLSLRREAPALGVDAVVEVQRILDNRPSVILDRDNDDVEINPATEALVRARLARDYRLAAAFQRQFYVDRVWALKR